MKKPKLPKFDSIEKLAKFWDTHDLTNFEDEVEEVTEPVFVRGKAIELDLEPREAKAVRQLAEANGVSPEELIRAWVRQQLARRNNGRRTSVSAQRSRRHRKQSSGRFGSGRDKGKWKGGCA